MTRTSIKSTAANITKNFTLSETSPKIESSWSIKKTNVIMASNIAKSNIIKAKICFLLPFASSLDKIRTPLKSSSLQSLKIKLENVRDRSGYTNGTEINLTMKMKKLRPYLLADNKSSRKPNFCFTSFEISTSFSTTIRYGNTKISEIKPKGKKHKVKNRTWISDKITAASYQELSRLKQLAKTILAFETSIKLITRLLQKQSFLYKFNKKTAHNMLFFSLKDR